jgi:hypothetical protein
VQNYFVFDCAIPDLREHIRCGNAVYTRMSEVEVVPAWLKHAQGVWLDGFDGDWCRALDIEDLLAREKGVCVVSPELHGRDPAPYWEMLKPLSEHPRLMLCTDHPVKARSFFDTSIIGRGQQ